MSDHKLILGDCLDELTKIFNKSVDLVLTDPPYGINYQSKRRKVKYNKIKNDDNIDWLYFSLKEFKKIFNMGLAE